MDATYIRSVAELIVLCQCQFPGIGLVLDCFRSYYWEEVSEGNTINSIFITSHKLFQNSKASNNFT